MSMDVSIEPDNVYTGLDLGTSRTLCLHFAKCVGNMNKSEKRNPKES